MRFNNDPSKLKVGDRVTTDFHQEGTPPVRILSAIVRDPSFASGYKARADDQQECPTCGKPQCEKTGWIDAAWFIKTRRKR